MDIKNRIYIDSSEIKRVYNVLKNRGMSINDIGKYIGTEFRNCLYKGYSLKYDNFEKLEVLLGNNIKILDSKNLGIKKYNIPIEFEETEKLSELIGIILGDGNIHYYHSNTNRHRACYQIRISLNSKDINYINYVKDLIIDVINKKPFLYKHKNINCMNVNVCGKSIILGLINKGLVSGNKVKANVTVPLWIKKNTKFTISCLRGLFDTDGSIYFKKNDSLLAMNFTNYSMNLLHDFKEMCQILGINTTKGRKNKSVQITSKKDIEKFLKIMKPKKYVFFRTTCDDYVKNIIETKYHIEYY